MSYANNSDNTLPGTLRDAIKVTRKLGLRYLWIDALCIFQDSDEDKGREIERMRDVYRGSVLTLEAASAARADEGFLEERQSSMPYCRLPWRSNVGQLDESCPSIYLRPIFDISDNQLLATKLYTRGWTLQERILPPRTLSFGMQQISFECTRGFVDESGHMNELPRFTEDYLSKKNMLDIRSRLGLVWQCIGFLIRLFRLPPTFDLPYPFNATIYAAGLLPVPGGSVATYYDYWRSVVQRFSERELTENIDRLPAVAGLAKELQSAMGDIYIAGLWKKEFVASLAWECGRLYDYNGPEGPVNNPSRRPPSSYVYDWPEGVRSKDYTAPSWSWASVHGVVRFIQGTYQVGSIPFVNPKPQSPSDVSALSQA